MRARSRTPARRSLRIKAALLSAGFGAPAGTHSSCFAPGTDSRANLAAVGAGDCGSDESA
jgi:hypothetical protein